MAVKSYRELILWQRAIDFAAAVHQATKRFPADERFGLTSQLRRSAVSVPSNIAEGQGRGSTRDFVHFLRIAEGSRQEAETQIELAGRFEYLPQKDCVQLRDVSEEVGRLCSGLIRSLENRRALHS